MLIKNRLPDKLVERPVFFVKNSSQKMQKQIFGLFLQCRKVTSATF